MTPFRAYYREATTQRPHNSVLGTHHDRLDTCHLAFTPVVGVLWVSKLDFFGNFLSKPKFGPMAEGVHLTN